MITFPHCHPMLTTATQCSPLPPNAHHCHPMLTTVIDDHISPLPPNAHHSHPWQRAMYECMHVQWTFGQITNAVRSSLRSIFFGPNSFLVKAISKAITNAVRPPFRTTVNFLWQNGKFTLHCGQMIIFSISLCA